MSKARIDDIEAAIVSTVQSDRTIASYVPRRQVQTLEARGVDFESGQIIVVPPAVLILYLGGNYEGKNITQTVYEAREPFLLLAVVENLRGAAEAKRGGVGQERGAYELIEDLKTLVAGKRLTVATGVDVLLALQNVTFEGVNRNQHFIYGLEVEARGVWDNA